MFFCLFMRMSYVKDVSNFSFEFQIRTKTNGGFLVASGDDYSLKICFLKIYRNFCFVNIALKRDWLRKGFLLLLWAHSYKMKIMVKNCNSNNNKFLCKCTYFLRLRGDRGIDLIDILFFYIFFWFLCCFLGSFFFRGV